VPNQHTVTTLASSLRLIKLSLLLLFGLAAFQLGLARSSPVQASGVTALAGRVVDSQGQPIKRAQISVYLNGDQEAISEGESSHDGTFIAHLPGGVMAAAHLVVTHPHFENATWQATTSDLTRLNGGNALIIPEIELQRRLTTGFWVATLVFAGILVLIVSERLHSTMAALLGVAIILGISLVGRPFREGLFIFDFDQALEYVDFNVIFLVLGMMIVVGVIEETGVFQWTSYQAYRISRGRVWLLAVILMLFTSVASALLDNVTTMLLVTPITFQIALTLGVNPLALLLPAVLSSNVGGISTLIGTPNNILIGSYANIGFNDFLQNLTPGVLVALAALTLYVIVVFRHDYISDGRQASEALLTQLKENARITQPDVLRKAGVVFVVMLLAFVLGERIHLPPAVTAIIGAVAILIIVRADVQEIMRVVDWTTLMFFIALFMVVGAIQEVGLISFVASGIHSLVGENLTAATLVTVWLTGLLCLVIPTIPLTAALLPVVGFLSHNVPGADNDVLFYSLSMGSALGANNSLIGATNNLVAAGIAFRAGYPISYLSFLRIGFPAAVITMAVGTLWLLIRF
jgi:Na+/H+ antiporter NhaD/arsenite permease-like protein